MKNWLEILACSTAIAVGANHARAQDITPPKAFVTTPGGINLSDGSIVYEKTDLSIGELTLKRFHRSGSKQPNDPMFGWNFSSNFDIYVAVRLQVTGTVNYVTVHIGNSASGSYNQSKSNPASIFADNLDGEKGRLTWSGSQYVYQDSGGTTYTFSSTVTATGLPFSSMSRRVERIDFADGRRQSFSYDGSGHLKLVEDSSGYAMVFDYNANGDVTAACAFNRATSYVTASSTCTGDVLKTVYAYTYISPRELLTSVTDVLGGATTYTNSNSGVTCIKPPGFASCTVTQGNGGPSASTSPSFGANQSFADGGTWTMLGWDGAAVPRGDDSAEAPYDGHVEVTLTDPDNKTTLLTFTKSSPYTITDANGHTTQFLYEGGVPIYDPWAAHSFGSMLREATYPEGDKYQAEHLGPFRSISKETRVAKPGSGLATLSKHYGYGSCTVSPGTYQNCAKPLWIKDPKGNQTDYSYAAHGGVLTEMQPAPSTGAPRPLKVYTYVQKYAYIKNAAGTLVAAAAPIWMPTTETICQTVSGSSNSTPVCDSGALQTVTSFEYGANFTANNLLLRGKVVTSGSTSLRTCYGYDDRGNKIFETTPRAGLTACS